MAVVPCSEISTRFWFCFFPQKKGTVSKLKQKEDETECSAWRGCLHDGALTEAETPPHGEGRAQGQTQPSQAFREGTCPTPYPTAGMQPRCALPWRPAPPRAPLLPAPGALRGKAGRCCSRARRWKGVGLAGMFSFASKNPDSYSNKIWHLTMPRSPWAWWCRRWVVQLYLAMSVLTCWECVIYRAFFPLQCGC